MYSNYFLTFEICRELFTKETVEIRRQVPKKVKGKCGGKIQENENIYETKYNNGKHIPVFVRMYNPK